MPGPRRSAVVAVVLCLTLFLWRPAAAQEAPSTTTTTRPRLTTTSIVQEEGDGGGGGLSTGNKVVVLIVGLVVLALLLIVFTWRYWRATKPRSVPVVRDASVASSEPARKSAPTV